MSALNKNNFSIPTQIQAKAIPIALSGKDVIATAQTGTGKTLAFGIPLISHLLNNTQDCALIMAPTRELAAQVVEMFKKIIDPRSRELSVGLLVGGDSITQQIVHLKKNKPRLIVGTPGRINDHINRRNLNLSNTRFLVLDEMDRMLDMGFSIAIDEILKYLPEKRQTLMFSATLPSTALNMAKRYLVEPVRIEVEQVNSQPNLISQETVKLSESEKYDHLLIQLDQRGGSIIIFVKTKINADKIAKKLQQLNHEAVAIHGDLRQSKRNSVIKSFRDRKNRIMVATDVAARGLDIPHIEHVINYDLPHCAEDYVHRIGRTGRAGATGSALNLVSPSDERRWGAIDKLLNPDNHKSTRASSGRGNGRIGSYSKSSSSGSRGSSSNFGFKNKGNFGEKREFERRDGNTGGDTRGGGIFGKKPYSKTRSTEGSGNEGNRRTGFGERSGFSGGNKSGSRGNSNYKGSSDFRGGDSRSGNEGNRRTGFGERSGFSGGNKSGSRGNSNYKGSNDFRGGDSRSNDGNRRSETRGDGGNRGNSSGRGDSNYKDFGDSKFDRNNDMNKKFGK